MAKKSSVEKNNRRKLLVAKYAQKRAELKAIVKRASSSMEERLEAQDQLSALPRNSSPVRVRNRCALTGRPRGYMGLFKLSRIMFRELALQGVLPGVKKTSW
jgi:small subunit ribosomal protein S14